MDRNENQNSYKKMNNKRGSRQQRRYRRNLIMALGLCGVFLLVIIVQTVSYVRLYGRYTALQADIDHETGDPVVTEETQEATGEESETQTETTESEIQSETTESEIQTGGEEETYQENTEESASQAVGDESEQQTLNTIAENSIQSTIDQEMAAVPELTGIRYWMRLDGSEEMFTNSESENPNVGRVSQYVNLYVLGALYRQLETGSVTNGEYYDSEGILQEGGDVRQLARIMLNRSEADESLASDSSGAARDLVVRIGETKDANGNVINSEMAFSNGIGIVNQYGKGLSLSSETFEISGSSQQEMLNGSFTISDCIRFFERLNRDGAGVTGAERLANMKNILREMPAVNQERYSFVTESMNCVGTTGEVLWVGESIEMESSGTVYEVVSVNSDTARYVAAVEIPMEISGQSGKLAEIIYSAVTSNGSDFQTETLPLETEEVTDQGT